MKSFEQIHAEYLQWVAATFPGETVEEQLKHLREEFTELGNDLTVADEYADVFMLLSCIAANNGIDLLKAFRDKLEVNKARAWEKTDCGFRHVHTEEELAR